MSAETLPMPDFSNTEPLPPQVIERVQALVELIKAQAEQRRLRIISFSDLAPGSDEVDVMMACDTFARALDRLQRQGGIDAARREAIKFLRRIHCVAAPAGLVDEVINEWGAGHWSVQMELGVPDAA